MRKAPIILSLMIGLLLVLIFAVISTFLYVAHQQAAKLDMSQIKSMISSYYNTKGVWAGQYVIKQIDQVKSLSQNDTKSILCVTYQYAYPSRPDLSQGSDRRTFLLQYVQNSWQVINMGEHLSC